MAKSGATSGAGSAAAPARALAPQARIEQSLSSSATPEMACSAMCDLFRVGRAEVALMRAENDVLNFLFPVELKAAGFIPLSSASADARRTARSRKSQLVKHFVIQQQAT